MKDRKESMGRAIREKGEEFVGLRCIVGSLSQESPKVGNPKLTSQIDCEPK